MNDYNQQFACDSEESFCNEVSKDYEEHIKAILKFQLIHIQAYVEEYLNLLNSQEVCSKSSLKEANQLLQEIHIGSLTLGLEHFQNLAKLGAFEEMKEAKEFMGIPTITREKAL